MKTLDPVEADSAPHQTAVSEIDQLIRRRRSLTVFDNLRYPNFLRRAHVSVSTTTFLKNANLVKARVMKIRIKTDGAIQIHLSSQSTTKVRLFKQFKEVIPGREIPAKVSSMPLEASRTIQ